MLSEARIATLLLLVAPLLSAVPAPAEDLFVEITRDAGVDFVHFNGMSGELYYPEMMGSGVAFFDYDGDGDLDLYLVQGAMLPPGKSPDEALFPPGAGDRPPRDRLLRNDLIATADGSLTPRFVDVTDAAGIQAFGYGMGVATGDVDGDGFVDLYLPQYGPNQLWHNNGDGTFSDWTRRSGVAAAEWSVSAAFFDYDRDGDLDLYVTDYVVYAVENNIVCYAPSSRRDYCGPASFDSEPDRLFRNRGDGTFEDVSVPTGIARVRGAGMGVAVADFNGDAWPDLYTANDGEPNFLWINEAGRTFRDEALMAGTAVNREGVAEASMGIAVGDFDGDGDDDLFLTHLAGETNTLYTNDGTGLFDDRTIPTGLAGGSLPFTSFGTAWFDFDNDGWLDLAIASGAVKGIEALAQAGDPYPLDQPNQLFHNREGKRFEDATGRAGPAFSEAEVSRGLAPGDVDNDGAPDLALTNNSGPARLLVNAGARGQAWLGLTRVGAPFLGLEARVETPGGPTLYRHSTSAGSYASAVDPRILVGLGERRMPIRLEISLPGAPSSDPRPWRLTAPPTNVYLVLPDRSFPIPSARSRRMETP